MTLTPFSENFAPLDEGVFFTVNAGEEGPADIRLDIVDSMSGNVVATQQLRGVRRTKVNIAPYINRFTERTPSQYPYATFNDAPTAIHHIRVEEKCSSSIITSVNLVRPTLPAIISAMPLSRSISHGESDEVLILAEEGDSITAELTSDKGEELAIEYTSTTGAVIFTLSTNDFHQDTRTVDVAFACNGTPLGTIRYNLAPRYKRSARLAWISEQGTIERYTFPTIAFATREKGAKRTVALQSHYEPCATIEALAEIVASPKVWLEREGTYREVTVATSTINYNLFNKPDSIILTLSSEGREEALW